MGKWHANISKFWKNSMKVFVLAPNENWICDRIVEEWNAHMSHLSAANISEADILWLQAGWCWNHIPTQILEKKKVLLTEHHIVPEKFGTSQRDEFKFRDQFIDAYHVPNRFTAKFIRGLTTKPIHVLGYWFDDQKWYEEDKVACCKSLGLPHDMFIVGSFQRDTEGSTNAPKLEKGPDLFCDYLESLNRHDLHVLLGGWRRGYVIDRLKHAGISFTYFEKASIDIVRKMYNACDLYIVASRYEGGPQAIYEAAAMKVPIISTNVGTASDVLCNTCIVDLSRETYYPTKKDIDLNFNKVQDYNMINHMQNYEKLLREIV